MVWADVPTSKAAQIAVPYLQTAYSYAWSLAAFRLLLTIRVAATGDESACKLTIWGPDKDLVSRMNYPCSDPSGGGQMMAISHRQRLLHGHYLMSIASGGRSRSV